jgi:hypothetical protein
VVEGGVRRHRPAPPTGEGDAVADDIFAQDDLDVYDFIQVKFFKKKETHFGTIYLDLESGQVNLRQRWKVQFIIEHGAADLSLQDKIDYYYKLKSLIWTDWNSRRPLPNIPGTNADPTSKALIQLLNAHNGVLFNVKGTSEFAQTFEKVGVPITFDVLLNRSHPHWLVKVYRPKPGNEWLEKYRDEVTSSPRVIKLNYANTEPHQVCNEVRPKVCQNGFLTPPHEFGHTIQSPDEYVRGSRFVKDTNSIMNIGREVRARHFRWILRELNTMLPRTVFSAPPN